MGACCSCCRDASGHTLRTTSDSIRSSSPMKVSVNLFSIDSTIHYESHEEDFEVWSGTKSVEQKSYPSLSPDYPQQPRAFLTSDPTISPPSPCSSESYPPSPTTLCAVLSNPTANSAAVFVTIPGGTWHVYDTIDSFRGPDDTVPLQCSHESSISDQHPLSNSLPPTTESTESFPPSPSTLSVLFPGVPFSGTTVHVTIPASADTFHHSHQHQGPEQCLVLYAEENFTITTKANIFEWKGYGLKVHVPENSLPQTITTARIDVKVCLLKDMYSTILLTGTPDQPASALYSMTVGEGKLSKPVTLEIQHCVAEVCGTELMFLRSDDCRQFNPMGLAVFECESQYGKVIVPTLETDSQEYEDFSWFIIVLRQRFLPGSIHYKALAYVSNNNKVMHFIVIMALDVCTSVGGYLILLL